VLLEAATAVIGFLAGLADFSVGAGFDALAVPSLILLGIEPQTAIAEGLFAQTISSTVFGVVKHKAIVTRKGVTVIAASSASALTLSSLSLSLPPKAVEAAVGAVLIMLSGVLAAKLVRVRQQAGDGDPALGGLRLAALALGAGAVKGLAGSGMSAVMMVGQLAMGVGVGKAVVMAVVPKSIPAAAALLPRVMGGGLDIAGSLILAAGASASIVIAEKIKSLLSPRTLSAALCAYSLIIGTYLVIKAVA